MNASSRAGSARRATALSLAAALVTAMLAVVAPALLSTSGSEAGAQSATVAGRGSPHRGMRLGKVSVTNTLRAVTATARVPGLAPHRGDVYLDLDVGNRDQFGGTSHSYVLRASVPRSADGETNLRFSHFSTVTQDQTVIACPDARAGFGWDVDRITMTVPQSCLGSDGGMTRASLQLWYPCDCDSPWALAQTGVLQSGPRGAKYGDVNGDGTVDEVRQTSPRRSRYKVSVDLGRRTVSATAPRDRDFAWRGARAWASIDVDHDGDAEVIGEPADAAGDVSTHHVFTMVRGQLELVRTAAGRPFELWFGAAGQDYYRDFRCGPAGLQTWQMTSGAGTDSYQMATTTWSIDGGTAVAIGQETVNGVYRGAAGLGNWSAFSCRTR